MKREDFPFLDNIKRNTFGLSGRVYNVLRYAAGKSFTKEFKSKDEILQFLKGKDYDYFRTMRNFGKKSFKELVEWVKKEIKNEKV